MVLTHLTLLYTDDHRETMNSNIINNSNYITLNTDIPTGVTNQQTPANLIDRRNIEAAFENINCTQ